MALKKSIVAMSGALICFPIVACADSEPDYLKDLSTEDAILAEMGDEVCRKRFEVLRVQLNSAKNKGSDKVANDLEGAELPNEGWQSFRKLTNLNSGQESLAYVYDIGVDEKRYHCAVNAKSQKIISIAIMEKPIRIKL